MNAYQRRTAIPGAPCINPGAWCLAQELLGLTAEFGPLASAMSVSAVLVQLGADSGKLISPLPLQKGLLLHAHPSPNDLRQAYVVLPSSAKRPAEQNPS